MGSARVEISWFQGLKAGEKADQASYSDYEAEGSFTESMSTSEAVDLISGLKAKGFEPSKAYEEDNILYSPTLGCMISVHIYKGRESSVDEIFEQLKRSLPLPSPQAQIYPANSFCKPN